MPRTEPGKKRNNFRQARKAAEYIRGHSDSSPEQPVTTDANNNKIPDTVSKFIENEIKRLKKKDWSSLQGLKNQLFGLCSNATKDKVKALEDVKDNATKDNYKDQLKQAAEITRNPFSFFSICCLSRKNSTQCTKNMTNEPNITNQPSNSPP